MNEATPSRPPEPKSEPSSTPASSSSEKDAELIKVRNRAFYMVLAAGFMTLLDVSIINVALPSIEAGLHAGAAEIQWIVAGYSVVFAFMLIPAGRIGDVVGRREMFLIGISGFVIASALCGFATSATWLAIARLIQGMFAGMLNPQVIALMQVLFKGPARARAFGLFGMIIGVSTAIGPTLGGVLVSALGPEYGWRSVFLINVPLGLIVVPLAAKFLKAGIPAAEDAHPHQKLNLDLGALLLIGVAVLAIMWPIVTASEHANGFAGAPWWLFAVAAVAVFVLVLWEKYRLRGGYQIVLPPELVKNPGFVLGTTLGTLFFAGFTGIFVVFSLFYLQGAGVAPWVAGLAQLPYSVFSAYAAQRSGKLVATKGQSVILFGLSIMISAFIAISVTAYFVPQQVAVWVLPVLMAVAGFGGGHIISPNQALALASVPGQLAGTASGVLQTFQRLGGSLGIAISMTVFYTTIKSAEVSLGAGDQAALSNLTYVAHAHALGLAMAYSAALVIAAGVVAVIDSRRRESTSAPLL